MLATTLLHAHNTKNILKSFKDLSNYFIAATVTIIIKTTSLKTTINYDCQKTIMTRNIKLSPLPLMPAKIFTLRSKTSLTKFKVTKKR